MKDIIIFIGSIIILFHVILTIWNFYSFRYLQKRRSHDSELNDSKYQELKAKHEFTVAVVSMAAAVIVFLGYTTIKEVQAQLKQEYTGKIDSINYQITNSQSRVEDLSGMLDAKLKSVDHSMEKYKNLMLYLETQQSLINKTATKSKAELESVQHRIQEINSKNILHQDIYIVTNVPYNFKVDLEEKGLWPDDGWHRIYFKDLRTITGDRLPIFKTSPFIVSGISKEGDIASFSKVTSESFEMNVNSYIEDTVKYPVGTIRPHYFNIMISQIND